MAALFLAISGSGLGVLAVPVLVVAGYAALRASWRHADRQQAARRKRLGGLVLERAFRNPASSIEPGTLARQLRLGRADVQAVCDLLLKEGYVIRNPKKQNRMFLSPAGLEAMRHRTEHAS